MWIPLSFVTDDTHFHWFIYVINEFYEYGINIELLHKIRYFVSNKYINPYSYKIDLENGIFYNTETSEVLEVRKDEVTNKYQIYKGSEVVYGEEHLDELELNKISGNKNMFAVTVGHNINFSKVYSDYIVDKTYTEGIIAEDKVMVLLNLLLVNIVKDMLDLEENKKYFIHIPDSIYLKPNKMDKIFKMFEDEYAKNVASNIINYSCEFYNGTGYPNGLKGDIIPIEAQIVSLVVRLGQYSAVKTLQSSIKTIVDKDQMKYNPELIEVLIESKKELKDIK